MALRVIYKPPKLLRLAITASFGAWSILFAYLVGYTDPPFAAVLLLLLPLLALAATHSLTNKGVTWEIDPTFFRKRIGDRLLSEIPVGNIGSLLVIGTPDGSVAHLGVLDRSGIEQVRLVPGPAINLQELRIIYEGLAYYLEPYGIEGSNPFGWRPELSTREEVQAEGQHERISPHFSAALIVAGVLILITGAYFGRPVPIQYGVGITLLGVTALGIGLLTRKKRKQSSDSPPGC